jgi:hypothetical protein
MSNSNRIYKQLARYCVYFHDLHTPVYITLWQDTDSDQIMPEYSHQVKTPAQNDPYSPDYIHAYDHGTPEAIVAKLVAAMDSFFQAAITAGHQPSESWLVPEPEA